MRTCTICTTTKPLEEFVPDRRYTADRRPECKPCFSRIGLRNRRRGLVLPESKTCGACGLAKPSLDFGLDKRNADQLRNNCLACAGKPTTDQLRARSLRFHYGMTVEEYDALLTAQGGVCAVCKAGPPTEGRQKYLAVDHCHQDGHVRGLLCNSCNTALGLLGDDVDRINALAEYLKTQG